MHVDSHSRLEDLPLNQGVQVLAVNEDGLVALEKPAGVMSHPNKTKDIERALIKASYDYEGEFYFWKDDAGNERKIWLINRLDSPTSGIILLGLNEAIAQVVKQEFSTHKVTKHYHAVVRNQPASNAGKWSDVITKDLVRNGRSIKKGHSVRAKSCFQYISSPLGGFSISLLKLTPITGRTHQLRIQCRKHKLPIVGDQSYGSFSFNKEVVLETGVKRMLLHASEVIVKYAFRGNVRVFRVKSELPEDFNTVLGFRPGMTRHRAAVAQARQAEEGSPLAGRRFKSV